MVCGSLLLVSWPLLDVVLVSVAVKSPAISLPLSVSVLLLLSLLDPLLSCV